MAPKRTCHSFGLCFCVTVLTMCKVGSAIPAPPSQTYEKSLQSWRDRSCAFPPKRIVEEVESTCKRAELVKYVTGRPTWIFIDSACRHVLEISSSICYVSSEVPASYNLTEEELKTFMENSAVDVCGKVAEMNATGTLPDELLFIVDDTDGTCSYLQTESSDSGPAQLLRLLYRLVISQDILPPSPEQEWTEKFTNFTGNWAKSNCTFPSQSIMEKEVNNVCSKPPSKLSPDTKHWQYQKKLCSTLYNVTGSVCGTPELRQQISCLQETDILKTNQSNQPRIAQCDGEVRLKNLLNDEDFDFCERAVDMKPSSLLGDLRGLTSDREMCPKLCQDLRRVAPVCRLLYFAFNVSVPASVLYRRQDQPERTEQNDKEYTAAPSTNNNGTTNDDGGNTVGSPENGTAESTKLSESQQTTDPKISENESTPEPRKIEKDPTQPKEGKNETVPEIYEIEKETNPGPNQKENETVPEPQQSRNETTPQADEKQKEITLQPKQFEKEQGSGSEEDVTKPAPQSKINESTSELEKNESTPHSKENESTSEPIRNESTPEPKVNGSTPEPKVNGSTPEPKVNGSTPQPKVNGSTPEPKINESTSEPKVNLSTPYPKENESTSEPKKNESTPEPKINGSKPQPTPEQKENQPTPDSEQTEKGPQESDEERATERVPEPDSADSQSIMASLQSETSTRIMMYMVIGVCVVVIGYFAYFNRKRLIDWIVGACESWKRGKDVKGSTKYSPLETAVEDYLPLNRAPSKRPKTHIY